MGFYGNITNINKTSFSFDRIYPNRAAMQDANNVPGGDGVYIGRFVLVDYDKDIENLRRVYIKSEDVNSLLPVYLYADERCSIKIKYNATGAIIDNGLVTGVSETDICYVWKTPEYVYYVCTEQDADGNALFSKNTNVYTSNYTENYSKDQERYGNGTSIGRGWDSTVWQKVYENEKEKYVMIAELNGVVPTLALSSDAPSLNPIAPHFDEVSNNTYYELHWQPQWGMRVKSARGDMSADSRYVQDPENPDSKLLSDEKTTWIQTVYNKELGLNQYYYYNIDNEWKLIETEKEGQIDFSSIVKFIEEKEDAQLPAAIYYNRAGFNSNTHFKSSIEDRLQMTATGYSATPTGFKEDKNGQMVVSGWEKTKYNDHNRGQKSAKVDTQEWEMILPSIGNAVNDMWDIVYGVGVDEAGDHAYIRDEKNKIQTDGFGLPIGRKDGDYNRLKFIGWNDGDSANDEKRLRLVNKDNNKFTYNPEEVATIAGCINSVHDLMGMIIVDKTGVKDFNAEDFLLNKDADADKIYYLSDGGYYRVGIGYSYDEVEYYYEQITLTENNYQQNFYYYLSDEDAIEYENEVSKIKEGYTFENIPIDDYKAYIKERQDLSNKFEEKNKFIADTVDKEFIEGRKYYAKKINNVEDEYTLTPLKEYDENVYYYHSGDDYRLETSAVARNLQYYELFKDKAKVESAIDRDFDPMLYWKKVDNNFVPAKEETPQEEIYYEINGAEKTNALVLLEDETKYDFNTHTYDGKTLTYFWTPGAFAVSGGIDEETGKEIFNFTNEWDKTGTTQYYLLDWYRKKVPAIGDPVYIPIINEDSEGNVKAYKVNLIDPEEKDKEGNPVNNYYKIEQVEGEERPTYVLATASRIAEEYKDFGAERLKENSGYEDDYKPNFNKAEYFTLNSVKERNKNRFYVTNTFYYDDQEGTDHTGNIIKDKSELFTPGRVYYTLTPETFEKVILEFYVPNKYYQMKQEEEVIYFILDKSFKMNAGDYYTRNYLYVVQDLQGLYAEGSQWNRSIDEVPCTIKLAKRTELKEFKILNGFSKSLNTIHGLILEINKILLSGDYDTRDRSTVQGCINLINDIINRFENFKPTSFLVSDNHGRMSSARIDDDEWVDVNIDGNPVDPVVVVKHMYPNKLLPSSHKTDLNDPEDDNTNINEIILQSIEFDDTGHVKKEHNETIVLPYGYKKFTGDEGNTSANNTQDEMQVKGDNWIKVFIENDKINLIHKESVKADSYEEKADETPAFGSTFTINDLYFDDNGHYADSRSHTITIPQGSLDDVKANGADLITQLEFTPTTGALSTTRTNVGALKLNGYSVPESGLLTASNTVNEAFNLLDAGLAKEISDRKAAITQEVSDRNDAIKAEIQKLDVDGANNIPANQTIYTWYETDGKINISTRDISIPSSAINDLSNNYNSTGTVAVTGQAIAQALNTLEYSITNSGNQVVKNVAQVGGKINVTLGTLTKSDISDLEELGTMATKDANDYVLKSDLGTMATEDVNNYVLKSDYDKLKSDYDLLVGRIEALEAYHPKEEPETPVEPENPETPVE